MDGIQRRLRCLLEEHQDTLGESRNPELLDQALMRHLTERIRLPETGNPLVNPRFIHKGIFDTGEAAARSRRLLEGRPDTLRLGDAVTLDSLIQNLGEVTACTPGMLRLIRAALYLAASRENAREVAVELGMSRELEWETQSLSSVLSREYGARAALGLSVVLPTLGCLVAVDLAAQARAGWSGLPVVALAGHLVADPDAELADIQEFMMSMTGRRPDGSKAGRPNYFKATWEMTQRLMESVEFVDQAFDPVFRRHPVMALEGLAEFWGRTQESGVAPGAGHWLDSCAEGVLPITVGMPEAEVGCWGANVWVGEVRANGCWSGSRGTCCESMAGVN